MQRIHLLRWLGLAIGLLGTTQCLDSLSDDCTKTLTCEDAEQPRLQPDCRWVYPDGRVWARGPSFDRATRTWRWPDGRPTATQNFQCNTGLVEDAGTDGGGSGPDCRDEATPCDQPLVCDEATGNCYECLSDAECAGNMPMGDAGAFTVCDLSIHRCVECTGDANCSGETPLCRVNSGNPRRNACVECLDNNDCDLPTAPICDDTTNECTASCQSAADCAAGEKKACNVDRRLCVECTDDSTCTAEGKPLCDTGSNQCVECLDDAPCAASGQVCDLESHTCVECKADAQCEGRASAAGPYCDLEDKRCVACLNDEQCTAGDASRCNTVLHQCAGCTNSSQCEQGQQCRVTGPNPGVCVGCLDDGDCTNPAQPYCETVSGRCVECFDSSQCPIADAARCETSPQAPPATRYTCVSCIENEDCTGGGKALPPLCDPARGGGTCSECTVVEGAADCLPRGPGLSRCQNGFCTVCSVDADCAIYANADRDRPACLPNVGCVQCTDNSDCADSPETPVCKTQAGGGNDAPAVNTCVECVTNGDCQGDASNSRCVDNVCQPCVVDADCATVDSNGNAPGGVDLNVCDAGTCVQCTAENRDACANGNNVCDSLAKTCTTLGVGTANPCDTCVSDAHCVASARCVQQTVGGTPQYFCYPAQANGLCPAGFAGPQTVPTIDSAAQPVCLQRETTCPAYVDYVSGQACDDEDDDEACGGGVGRCEFGPQGFRCTIVCRSQADCSGGSCLSGVCEL